MGILEIVLPVAVSFVITVIAGKLLIPALVRLKAGQSIKEIGPTWHMTKQGTPTMGGLMFIIGIGITIVALGWKHMRAATSPTCTSISLRWCSASSATLTTIRR